MSNTQPVEKLIRQACKTFYNRTAKQVVHSEDNLTGFSSATSFQPLIDALGNCSATNLNLFESMKTLKSQQRAPVTYMDICDNRFFTIGVFILHPGSRLPLHDHPGMFGAIRVIHGEVRVQSFTAIGPVVNDRLSVVEEPSAILSTESLPIVLTPAVGNYHEIQYYKGEFAAILDILAPPYYSINKSKPTCTYYTVNRQCEPGLALGKSVKELLISRCPTDYFTNSIPYKGPSLKNILGEHE